MRTLFILSAFIGTQWISAQSLLWLQTSTNGGQVLTAMGGTLFAGGGGGIHSTSDKGNTWTHRTSAYSAYFHALTNDGSNVYAGGMTGSAAIVLKSSDSGNSWTNLAPPGLTVQPRALCVHNGMIYLAVRGGASVYAANLTGPSATTWTPFGLGLAGRAVMALAVSGGSLLATTEGDGVFRTALSAAAWQNSSTGITNSYKNGASLSARDSIVFASMHTGSPNLFKSTDYGKNWTSVSKSPYFDSGTAYHVSIIDGVVYVGFELGTGPAVSKDMGSTWATEATGMTTKLDKNVSWYAKIGTTLFAGAMSGVWRTEVTTATDDVAFSGSANEFRSYVSHHGEIMISSRVPPPGSIAQVREVTGRLLAEEAISSGQTRITTDGFKPGIYLLYVLTPDGVPYVSKLLLNKQ